MSEASSSSRCNPERRSKHAISFLLNPETRTRCTDCGAATTPVIANEWMRNDEAAWTPSVGQETINMMAIEDGVTNGISRFEMTSSATRVCSTLSVSGDITLPCEQISLGTGFTCVTGESPNHERCIHEEGADGTRHISLDNGELITNSPKRRGRPRKRKRKQVRTNLQQKRSSMASHAYTTEFSTRYCCKKLRCYEKVDEGLLRKFVKETLLMCQPDRKKRLRSWLVDGEFVFCRKRVCSAFLAGAFGFSRDLQRAVKTGGEGGEIN